jgi:dTDP-4-dehydrorhamnose reductase
VGIGPGTKRILVIGSAGLLGGNLLRLSPHYSFVVIPAFHAYIPEEYRAVGLQLDITGSHVGKKVANCRPDCVVNLSCMGVAQAEADPDQAHAIHISGARELARACRDHGIRLVHLSTDMVYSGRKGAPYTLDDEPDPVSVYGCTKLEGEKAVGEAGCNHVIVRSALVLGRDRFRRRGFLEWMVATAEKGEKLPLYADQLRTPITVDDLVDVIFRLADSSYTGVLLAGGDEGLSRVEMGRQLISAMGRSHASIQPICAAQQKSTVPLQLDLRLDNSSLKKIVGGKELTRLDEYFAGLFKSPHPAIP